MWELRNFQVLFVINLALLAILGGVEQCNARKMQARIAKLEKVQGQQKRWLSVTRYAVKRLAEPDPSSCSLGQRAVCEDLE